MPGSAAAAETAAAQRKVKQALAACRTAAQRLAQAQDLDVIGQRTCANRGDVDAITSVIELALSEHEHVDVVVIASARQQQ